MNQTEIKKTFSENLKRLMGEKNINQANLAKASDLNQQNISKYCKGTSLPDLGSVAAIAEALNVSVDSLLGLDSVTSTTQKKTAQLSNFFNDLVTISDTLNLKVHNRGFDLPISPVIVPDEDMLEFDNIDISKNDIVHKCTYEFFKLWAIFRNLLENGTINYSEYKKLVNDRISNYSEIKLEDSFLLKQYVREYSLDSK